MLLPDLLRFAFWLARDRSVAEDVVQETLIRAWKSKDELKDPAAARPWLFTIVRREHARLYERKRLPTVDVEEVEALGDPALASDGDAGLTDLRRAIMQLPDEYREPLVLQVLGVIEPNLLAAYSSNLFGITCVALVKIRHVRPDKRQLILEVLSVAVQ